MKSLITKSGFFEGRENRELFYQYWEPEGDIRANIVAIHGWGTHSNRMKIPAESLTEKGYALFSFDLRGHWRNTGDNIGHIDSMDHLQKDIVLFMDVVKKESKDKKIFLMGHSFGGLVALIYAINHPDLASVIASSPLLGLSEKMSFGKKMIKNLSAKFSPEKTVPYLIDQKDLTSDIKVLREYIADKNKLEVISAKSFIEMKKSMKWAMDHVLDLLCPCLILQAGKERLGDKEKTKDFFSKIKSQDKSYKEYEDFLHDVLNEKRRAQVHQDIDLWISKILGIKSKNQV